jgi:hypothetical protein
LSFESVAGSDWFESLWCAVGPSATFSPRPVSLIGDTNGQVRFTMKHFMRAFSPAIKISAAALYVFGAPTSVSAYEVSAPIAQGNLAVYFIRDTKQTSSNTMTMDYALRSNLAEIREGPVGLTAKNLSNRPILLPFGSLLRGGSQDQVVAASSIIPPHSGSIAIDTYCVDPFRNSPRFGEPSQIFRDTGLLSPSRSSRLSLLIGAGHWGAIARVRQAGVWWSIDTIRQQLGQQTGSALAPRVAARWAPTDDPSPAKILQARQTRWTDSLPLALEDPRLGRLEHSLTSALVERARLTPDVIGAAFAINGQWAGADMFQSHALFEQMWPQLLRSFAIESIAERNGALLPLPTPLAVKVAMGSAQIGSGAEEYNGQMKIIDGRVAIVTQIADDSGQIVETALVPKLDPSLALQTPDGAIVQMLATGQVAGHPIDRLEAAPLLTVAAATGEWSGRPELSIIQADRPTDKEAAIAVASGNENSRSDDLWSYIYASGFFCCWGLILFPLISVRIRLAARQFLFSFSRTVTVSARAATRRFAMLARSKVCHCTIMSPEATVRRVVDVIRLTFARRNFAR